jgi:Protein of unknown function (DUF1549)/Protein of unknown function (DUF1553)/Bacterial Ig-like domain (group 2)
MISFRKASPRRHGDTEKGARRKTPVGAPLVGALHRGTGSRTGHPQGVPLLLFSVYFSVSPCLRGEAFSHTSAANGQPKLVAIAVEPAAATLEGKRARQALLVTGRYSDGSVRDLTAKARWQSSQPRVAAVAAASPVVRPVGDGAAVVTASVPGAAPAVARVTVKESGSVAPVSFHHEVMPVLTRAGCNMGTCHGTPTGKGGFRLSLQGYAPDTDYERLTHESGGRRANRMQPDASLILRKPLAEVPHRGGQRFPPGSTEHQILRRWITEGLKTDPPGAPKVTRLEVLPGERVLMQPARSQQLVVRARFSDGSVRDVSHLVKFSSSDDTIAQVTQDGLVTGQRRGEAAILCRYEHLVGSVRLTFLEPVPGLRWVEAPARSYVDQAVFAKLRLMRYPPAALCTDTEFLRRAYLDTLGALPTPAEVRAFLADRSPNKRAKYVDRLLARPEFADFWALKWSDLLRISEETLQSTGVRAYHDWIRQSIAQGQPLDQFVRELVTARGHTLQNPAANYFRAVSEPTNWMETTAQLFMGRRVQCAKCHNHPFDRMTQDDYYALAAFFAQVRDQEAPPPAGAQGDRRRRFRGQVERMIALDPSAQMTQPRTGEVMAPRFPGGEKPAISEGADRREALANWLTSPHNPYFAPAMANRIWFHLMGRGIVDPVDDFRDTNPSVNDPLLSALARDLVVHRYDLRHLVRVIMNSRTYQLSARPHPLSRDDTVYFSHAVPRLLTAEQLLDAVSAATGVPEEFFGMPEGTRAVQLPGTSARSAFLAAFGRPARKLACECERERDPTLYQALQLISGRAVNGKLRSDTGRIATLVAKNRPDDAAIEELYLASLSRPPSDAEKHAARQALQAASDRRQGLEDLLWALLNSKEFLFRH